MPRVALSEALRIEQATPLRLAHEDESSQGLYQPPPFTPHQMQAIPTVPLSLSSPIHIQPSRPLTVDGWITVFGFQPGNASLILSEFQEYGTIIGHRSLPSKNWIDIQYEDPVVAEQVLAKNGKMLHGTMIGVIPTPHHHHTVSSLIRLFARSLVRC